MSGDIRNPDLYTSAMFRAEYPGLTPGQICPSCEEPDSAIADDGVCYFCVCGCSYCEPDDDPADDHHEHVHVRLGGV